MIAFDIVFLLAAGIATAFVLLRFDLLRAAGAQFGATALLAGIWLIALLYGFDLVTMLVLPSIIGMESSMAIMRDTHVAYSWYVSFAAQMLLVTGLLFVVSRLLSQHAESVEAVENLSVEIDERAAIENELRETESRYKHAAEIARLGHYVWDAVDDTCLFCSANHASFHGLTTEEFVARSNALSEPFSIASKDDREAVRSCYQRLWSGEPIEMEYCIRDGSRALRIREIARPVFDGDGRVIRGVATSLDITAQYLAEQKSRRSQRFEIIGQLAGGVAHDFNNLLAVIVGNLELIEGEQSERELRQLIRNAVEAASRGSELTQSLLTFAGKAQLKPEHVDLNKMIVEAKSWIGRTLPANIEVQTIIPKDLWGVHVDRSSIESAFLNLIINARDAMPKGGRLEIESCNVRFGLGSNQLQEEGVPEGSYVLLSVRDTGHGMASEVLDRIFEPFYSTKAEGEGTGLGLSTVHGFVEQSGGFVRVVSEPDEGTALKLYFPARLEPGDVSETPRRPQHAPNTPSQRILLAEDRRDVQAVLVRQLQSQGHEVVAFSSGDEAAEFFETDQAFDILLTDIIMPGELQGPDLAKRLREALPTLPVIFVSGHAEDLTAGANAIGPEEIRLMKPVRRQDLLTAVDRIARERTQAEGALQIAGDLNPS